MVRLPFSKFVAQPPLPLVNHVRSIIEQLPHPMLWESPDDVRWTWPDGTEAGYILRYSLAERTFTSEHMRVPRGTANPSVGNGSPLYALDIPTALPDDVTALFRAALTDRDLAYCTAASIRFGTGNRR